MLNFDGYHGTNNAHVRSILKTGFKHSASDRDWLGDGAYFFVNGKSLHPDRQAEQWAVLSAWDSKSQSNKYQTISVLKADISVDESNLLDLTCPEGIEIFEYLKKKCIEKLKSRRLLFIDGFLINWSRNEMNLKFDVVKGDVFIKLTKEERIFDLRSRIPNSTICAVYNTDCISNITNIKVERI